MTKNEAIKEFYEILELGAVDYQDKGLITRIYNDFETKINGLLHEVNQNIVYINEKDKYNVLALQSLAYLEDRLKELRNGSL